MVKSVLLVLLVGSVVWAAWLDNISINKVIVAGASASASDAIQKEVLSVLGQTYLSVLPKKNFLIYPKGDIEKQVMKDHPEIGAVTIATENVNTLNVRLTERTPAALWCKGDVCFMVDKNAYIYALNGSTSAAVSAQNAGLLSLHDLSSPSEAAEGTEAKQVSLIGKQAMSPKAFNELLEAARNLSSSSLPVERVNIEEGGKYVFKIKDNGRVIFSDKKPLQKSLEDLMSARQSPVFAKSDSFQYIDTRFGNKVFYRLSDGEGDGEVANSAEGDAATLNKTDTNANNATGTVNAAIKPVQPTLNIGN
jgi:hypothetical protein